MTMLDEDQMWGQGEIEDFIPPDEVVEQVLEMPEVAMDYPDVFEQAIRIKKQNNGNKE